MRIATAILAEYGTVSLTMIRDQIVDLALDETELSPRELAVRYHGYPGLLRLGGVGLQASQGPRPDHQPGFCRHQGGR